MSLRVPLLHGNYLLIDEDDYAAHGHMAWVSVRIGTGVYVCAWSRTLRKNVYLHRLIMNAPSDVTVDHVNRDGLDNRRCNLRLATQSQNNANKENKRDEYRGVYRTKSGRFQAKISDRTKASKCKSLGTFTTQTAAASAYDAAALEKFGEFAQLNFPDTEGLH